MATIFCAPVDGRGTGGRPAVGLDGLPHRQRQRVSSASAPASRAALQGTLRYGAPKRPIAGTPQIILCGMNCTNFNLYPPGQSSFAWHNPSTAATTAADNTATAHGQCSFANPGAPGAGSSARGKPQP